MNYFEAAKKRIQKTDNIDFSDKDGTISVSIDNFYIQKDRATFYGIEIPLSELEILELRNIAKEKIKILNEETKKLTLKTFLKI